MVTFVYLAFVVLRPVLAVGGARCLEVFNGRFMVGVEDFGMVAVAL